MELQRSGPLMAPESITEQKSLGFSANPPHTINKESWLEGQEIIYDYF
jgi:hypothetical protein